VIVGFRAGSVTHETQWNCRRADTRTHSRMRTKNLGTNSSSTNLRSPWTCCLTAAVYPEADNRLSRDVAIIYYALLDQKLQSS
jgi:hypothetical protein